MKERWWIWRHFRICLPAEWEMLQFSRSLARGRCAFADRYALRLEMDWRVVPGPPDFERMMGDYVARLQETGHRDVRRVERSAWRGIASRKDGMRFSRFGAYFDRESCLLELVFLWGEEARDSALEQAVLSSVSDVPADEHGRRRWRAFGLDLQVDGTLRKVACRVEPGSVDWVFADERDTRRVRVRRIGLRRLWMKDSIEAWLDREAPGLDKVQSATSESDRHRMVRRFGRVRQGLLQRALRGSRFFHGEVWVCPVDDRLYAREIEGPEVFVHEESERGRLRCGGCIDLDG